MVFFYKHLKLVNLPGVKMAYFWESLAALFRNFVVITMPALSEEAFRHLHASVPGAESGNDLLVGILDIIGATTTVK